MTLHLVYSLDGYTACCAYQQPDDQIVLLGNGVYVRCDTQVFGLEDDYAMAGVTAADNVELISYGGLVELTTTHQPIISWND